MPHKDGISHVILNRKENESLKTELEMYKMKIILDQIDKGTFSSAISSKVETITDKLLFAPYINLLKLNSHDHRATNIFGKYIMNKIVIFIII